MSKNPKDKKDGRAQRTGVSRRGFIASIGVGAGAVATLGPAMGSLAPGESAESAVTRQVTLRINGRERRLLIENRWSLLRVLRERLGLTAAKAGCERGECGACTVLIDGEPRYACLTLAVEVEGREITTLEGLMDGERLTDLQQAFVAEDAFQCGYCTSGQIVAAEGLLRVHPQPSPDELRQGLSGNLCRCGAYTHIAKAVTRTAKARQEESS